MTHRTWRGPALIALLALTSALLLAGCSAAPAGKATAPAEPSTSAAAVAPTLKVLAPVDAATVKGADVSVKVETTGLKFVMPSNTLVPGEGHVHFILDDQPLEMSTSPEYVFKGVAAGEHTLEAQLVQNDTTPFDPPVVQTVTFTVEP